MTISLSLEEVDDLTMHALMACDTSKSNARSVTNSVVASEADGIHSHGLARLPTYCEHARCGKIDGNATPSCEQVAPGALKVDARDGFAHPAIDLGMEKLISMAKQNAIVAMAVTNSYNCGVVGYHMEHIANAGMVALGFVNAPASIAPWGGTKAVFGTNPIACAIPRRGAPPMVLDQSSSVVAKSEVTVHAQKDEAIPEGWAFDKDGNPTTDPKVALDGGTMVPSGGYKGAGLALLVEIMAAGLTGATWSSQASSFADNSGGPPRTGQFFIAMNPEFFAGANFSERIEFLFGTMLNQDGVRLPGDRRLRARRRTATEGVTIRKSLYDKLLRYCDK
ncbi:MAG: Ldh family oxidoreductase [Acidiferrobacterales bacterium]